MKIAQIGKGFVGSALNKSFKTKGVDTIVYDKFQRIGNIKETVNSDIIFLCLPTPFVKNEGFDLSAIEENLKVLSDKKYKGLCIIKSTVEIGVTKMLANKYNLNIAHNPEFLTERTAFEDFNIQKHIVLGRVRESKSFDDLILFYKDLYPDATISICSSDESEAMKLFCNNFYAMKVMIFNEFYFLCTSIGIEYDAVKNLMFKNDWINPNHTLVPGPDGKVAYGGGCFCKDTEALLNQMKKEDSLYGLLEAAISERNLLRQDMTNIIDKKIKK
jgi:UDPglucose 6-dehydrogenase